MCCHDLRLPRGLCRVVYLGSYVPCGMYTFLTVCANGKSVLLHRIKDLRHPCGWLAPYCCDVLAMAVYQGCDVLFVDISAMLTSRQ